MANTIDSKSVIVVVLAIVSIVLVVAIDSGGITGNTVTSCFDSDPLEDFYVRGYAEYRGERQEDRCSTDGNRLLQFYCESSNRVKQTHGYYCPYGCIEGVCVSSTANCGDGKLNQGEWCDDGNLVSGDGCSDGCNVEAGFSCIATSVCANN